MNEVLINVEEAARRLSLSRALVFRLIAQGELASVKVGSRRLVPVRALHEYTDYLLGDKASQ